MIDTRIECKPSSCIVTFLQVVVRQREPLCHACLQESIAAKVRTTLRGDGLIKPGDHIALAFSGGHASAVLLRTLCEMRSSGASPHPEKRKVPFSLHIIHIDERVAYPRGEGSDLLPADEDGYRRRLQAAVAPYLTPPSENSSAAVSWEVISISDGGRQEGEQENGDDNHIIVNQALDRVPDPTARDDALRALRIRLLSRAAVRAGARSLLIGSSGTRLAAEALAECCKGRGADVALGARLVDDRRPALRVLRPLRGCSTRELACCAHALRLPLAQVAPLRALCSRPGRNVNLLVEDFVLALLAANPSAVSNIHSVLDKLAVVNLPRQSLNDVPSAEEARWPALCLLCDGPVPPDSSSNNRTPTVVTRTICASCEATAFPADSDVDDVLRALADLDWHREVQGASFAPRALSRQQMHAAVAEFLLP